MKIVQGRALHYFFAPMVGVLSITNIIPIASKLPKLPIFPNSPITPNDPNASNASNVPNDPIRSLNLRHEPTARYNGKRKATAFFIKVVKGS